MELKRICPRSFSLSSRFLIEPMWNWNSGLRGFLRLRRKFLIEPMWNWNQNAKDIAIHITTIFNWTNVELKPARKWWFSVSDNGFLIEPMWNWNWCKRFIYISNVGFLIEPMWNWNYSLIELVSSSLFFLIEPMWNWNYVFSCGNRESQSVFNWTNVELKQRLSLTWGKTAAF